MICSFCENAGNYARAGEPPDTVRELHDQCPDVARRKNRALKPFELAGSHWCTCQHKLPARPVPGQVPAPTLNQ